MEIRSSRRLRTLVTQMALRGLSANEIAGALIPMMARARRSNQRPDTLMQDRYRQLDEILLLRTAGPYIGSEADSGRFGTMSAIPPRADKLRGGPFVRLAAGSTGRRNTRVTLTKRSPNRLHDSRLPAMPKLRFLGRS